MIVGGIVFRVVTALHPGCPKLAAAGAPEIRTEYLSTEFDPAEWTVKRGEAFFFAQYSEAGIRAGAIGSRCHARVATPPDQESIPEELQPLEPLQILPPPPAYPAKKKQRTKRVAVAPHVEVQRRDWVKETYG